MVGGTQGARLVEAGLPSLSESSRKLGAWGLPWQSSSWDSTVAQQGHRFHPWSGELRSCRPHGVAKKEISELEACQLTSPALLYGIGSPVPSAELATAVHEASSHRGLQGDL